MGWWSPLICLASGIQVTCFTTKLMEWLTKWATPSTPATVLAQINHNVKTESRINLESGQTTSSQAGYPNWSSFEYLQGCKIIWCTPNYSPTSSWCNSLPKLVQIAKTKVSAIWRKGLSWVDSESRSVRIFYPNHWCTKDSRPFTCCGWPYSSTSASR